ncbi:3-oxoacyl-[acyl-carrier-protein] synthase II [Staphylococcus epidermidis]|uniref:beta-ketoacyl synthase N-terminal-like domain-containing protein n=1 Tax=Staphylococcus epidermidis TaxID=1282 RepID=UPI0019326DC8|nr:beta-ketoacyl synthase N-terminal-like domain-containing protein [Staphylococcus epidermidis]
MDKDKIVISGIGSISPFGYTLEDFWKGIIGQYQIDTIFTDYDTFLNVPSIKEIIIQKWNPESILEKKGLKYMTKSTQLLLSSAVLSHQKDDFYADTEIGVTVATNFSGVQPVSEYDYTILTEGPQYVSPMQAPNTLTNAPSAQLALKVNARAFNTTLSTGQCSSINSIIYGAESIQKNISKCAFVSGVEEINKRTNWLYYNMNLLENSEYCGVPYNQNSNCIIPSEGSGTLFLETYKNCIKRKKAPLAYINSYTESYNYDRNKLKNDIISNINETLAKNTDNINITAIFSGANGIYENDSIELSAIKEVFKNHSSLKISPIKGRTGDTYGNSGIFQVISAILAFKFKTIPYALNIENGNVQNENYQNFNYNFDKDDGILILSWDSSGNIASLILKNGDY